MTAKEYLSQARIAEKIISAKLKDIAYWRDLADSLSGIDLSEHFNPNRPEEAKFAHCIAIIAEIQEEIDKQTAELMEIRKEIESGISHITNLQEQLVLRCRYLNHMEWDEISTVLGICVRSIYRIHKRALLHFPVPDSAVSKCQKMSVNVSNCQWVTQNAECFRDLQKHCPRSQ